MTEFRSDAIDELERLRAAATSGNGCKHDVAVLDHDATMPPLCGLYGAVDPWDAKTALYRATHNHLPALLAMLREMREALEQIRDAGHENGNYCEFGDQREPENLPSNGLAQECLDDIAKLDAPARTRKAKR